MKRKNGLYKNPKLDARGCRTKDRLDSRQQSNSPKQMPYPPSTILDGERMCARFPIYIRCFIPVSDFYCVALLFVAVEM